MELTVQGDIGDYYATGAEGDRLGIGYFQLERIRTEEILAEQLPRTPAKVFDVGGGTGPYARALTAKGYEVHLLDPIPRHVEAARQSDAEGIKPAGAGVGDARELPWGKDEADAVLLLGPLYHLPDSADRMKAISEAHRVLRPGGSLLAAGISRLSIPFDGIKGPPTGRPEQPLPLKDGLRIVIDVMRTGRYSNPTGDPNMFTTAYMHTPTQLEKEIEAGGFDLQSFHAVEGPGAWMPGFNRVWRSDRAQGLLCGLARVSSRASILRAVTPHMLVVACKSAC
jgi:SAM-dependent methyltransferase